MTAFVPLDAGLPLDVRDALRDAIKRSGWSYATLAMIVGCSESLIGLIVTGRRHPTPVLARSLVRELRLADDTAILLVGSADMRATVRRTRRRSTATHS